MRSSIVALALVLSACGAVFPDPPPRTTVDLDVEVLKEGVTPSPASLRWWVVTVDGRECIVLRGVGISCDWSSTTPHTRYVSPWKEAK